MSSENLDRALLEQVKAGHEQAFELLVQRHRDRVYTVALRLTAHRQDAEDVTQEAFLRAWTGLPRFRGDASLETWLYRIVINQVHHLRRRSRPAEPIPESLPDPITPGVAETVEELQRRRAAAAAIAGLPMEHRAPLVLHHFAGRTYGETALILGISESAAKVRVFRARRLLAEQLAQWR